MSTRFRSLLVTVAASALLVVGCGPDYDHTDITYVKSSRLGGSIDMRRVEVPVGMIVIARIVSYDDDRKPMDAGFRVKDEGIVEVTGVVSDGDYAFLGLHTGATEIEIRADGKLVLIISAVVTGQPALP